MNAVAALPYAEFAVRSNFSFLHGASRPEELAVTAKLLGLMAFGLADTNSVAGVVRAWQQAKVEGLAYHPGARLEFSDGTPDILAYPQDRRGWGHLCRMLTKANQRGEKGAPDLRLCDLVDWGESLSLAVMPTFGVLPPARRSCWRRCGNVSGGRSGLPSRRSIAVTTASAWKRLKRWRSSSTCR